MVGMAGSRAGTGGLSPTWDRGAPGPMPTIHPTRDSGERGALGFSAFTPIYAPIRRPRSDRLGRAQRTPTYAARGMCTVDIPRVHHTRALAPTRPSTREGRNAPRAGR